MLHTDDPALALVRAGRATLRRGDTGEAVSALQRVLAALAFPVDVDGAFGPQTERVVRVMQVARDCSADGVVGKATVGALAEALAAIPTETVPMPPRVAYEPLQAHPGEPVAGLYSSDHFPGRVALTFDDGPYPGRTEVIQQILSRFGVPATFFVTGERVLEHPDLMREHLRLGFDIGQHSWDHPEFGRYDDAFIADQLDRTNEAIDQVLGTGRRHPLRPPYGSPFFGTRSRDVARRVGVSALMVARGMDLRMWQIDTRDWEYSWRPWEVVRKLKSELARTGGGVILMHDIKQQTVEALPGVLDVIRQAGLQTVRDSALLLEKYAPPALA